jgi:hypothetical protein
MDEFPENKEDGLIEHEVVIDNYISATLKIPKLLTALELKGLMIKAKKLYELSGNDIHIKRPYNKKNSKKEKEVTIPLKAGKQNSAQKYIKWEDAQIKILKNEINKRAEGESVMDAIRRVNKRIGYTEQQCFDKYKNMMVRDGIWKSK